MKAHSTPERQTRSQARAQAVLTPTPRVALDGTPVVPQLRPQLYRVPHLEGAAPSRKEGRGPRRSNFLLRAVGGFPGLSRTTFKGPGEDGEEGEENSVKEEESDGMEGVPAPVVESQGTGRPTLAKYHHPFFHQSEPFSFTIMQKMTQIMANNQVASYSKELGPPAFKNSSRKTPECFDETQLLKLRSFIQSCQLIFYNDREIFSQDRKKVLYYTSFSIERASKWIEPYLPTLTNQYPATFSIIGLYLNLNSSPYLATEMKSLASRIGDWGERALIHHFRKGFPSRILDKLPCHPSRIDSLQYLMDITLELDTRYHERKKEKTNHQEKNPQSLKSNSSHPQSSSSSS
ncbi:hypothetical protein O181_039202 [Austropuccinia psidii MF-1]|uniref:Uncharacterized protein n=1 Tax=Austropuccinia psidii MF-1 TaxID=1389203 RepID=A0A9Q3DGA9_9BASI|nr:hypothetical protein [Austropuccinia psidii MF-1]